MDNIARFDDDSGSIVGSSLRYFEAVGLSINVAELAVVGSRTKEVD